MSSEWTMMAKEKLAADDQICKTFPARFNGRYGHVILSTLQLMFIEEKGFFRKTYDITLTMPYEKIRDHQFDKSRSNLVITDTEGKKYNITSEVAFRIEQSLNELK